MRRIPVRAAPVIALAATVALACLAVRPVAAATGNPFAGSRLWVDPSSEAARQAQAWRTSRPADARLLDKIAGQPLAAWFDHSHGVS